MAKRTGPRIHYHGDDNASQRKPEVQNSETAQREALLKITQYRQALLEIAAVGDSLSASIANRAMGLPQDEMGG